MKFINNDICIFNSFYRIYQNYFSNKEDDILIVTSKDHLASCVLGHDDLFATNPALNMKNIGYNENNCNAIDLTEDERYAMIAHELGHIYNVSVVKCVEDKFLNQELNADIMACELKLGNALITGLTKILGSKYSKNESQIKERIDFLSSYLSL